MARLTLVVLVALLVAPALGALRSGAKAEGDDDRHSARRARQFADTPQVLGRHGKEDTRRERYLQSKAVDDGTDNDLHFGGLSVHDEESSEDAREDRMTQRLQDEWFQG